MNKWKGKGGRKRGGSWGCVSGKGGRKRGGIWG